LIVRVQTAGERGVLLPDDQLAARSVDRAGEIGRRQFQIATG